MKFLRIFLVWMVCIGAVSAASGQVFDAYAGFSLTQNPSGPWSYGWSSTLAGPLTVYTGTYQANGTYNWTDFSIEGDGDPNIGYQPVAGGLPAGVIGASPGPGNQFTHCLFTAPAAGTYTIQGTFVAVSYGQPQVYILHNGTSIVNSSLSQSTPWAPSFTPVTLAAGDTIDVVTGVGTNDSFFNDEIYFNFTVTMTGTSTSPPAIPPPQAGPTVYDAFGGFSITQNPVGPWTYGWSTNLAGPLVVYSDTFEKEGGYNWTDYSIEASGDPNIGYVPATDGTAPGFPAGVMGFSPGPGNQYSHCQFTAPTAGTYMIQGTFTATSYGQPQISILHNGTSIGSKYVSYGTPWAPTITSVTLAAGDTVDAVIGVGTDQSYFDDEVYYTFTVTLTGTSPPPPPAGSTVYDAFAGFSLTQNPVGPWTYGWSSALAGPLTVYTGTYQANGTYNWTDFSIEGDGDPNIGYQPVAGGLPAGVIGASPGPGNQFTHCQFTAPAAGTYTLQGTFVAVSNGQPHVYILHNGTSIADSSLSENTPWTPPFTPVTLAAGDTIDVVTGVGTNDSFFNDEIYFNFTVTQTGTNTTPPSPPIPPPQDGPTVYDAFAGFSITQNPVGPWTYGWSTNLAGPLVVYSDTFEKEGGYNWTDYSIEASGDPNIGYVPATDGTAPGFPAGVMGFSPGPGNQYSHCEFTAPTAGTYMIQGTFTATSYGQPQISILHNGTSIGSKYVSYGTPWAPTITSVTLAAGDTVDAVIGVGTDQSYFDDEVYYTFTVTLTGTSPPPPVIPPPTAGPTVYDAFAGFSLTQNPVGPWTYGWSSALAGPLTVYTGTYQANGTYNWTDFNIESAGDPNIGYQPVAGGLPAKVLGASPGPGNQFTHCQFTAPAAGTYTLQGTFVAVSNGQPHVYILHNGTSIADSSLSENTPWAPSFTPVTLAAGDTIDVVTGVGTDDFFSNDEIYFNFTLMYAPLQPGPFVAGTYTGLLTGTSGPGGYGGVLTAKIQKNGSFTAQLNLEGTSVGFKGRFSGSSPYSTVIKLKNGTEINVSLGFDENGKLTGTVSDASGTFDVSTGSGSKAVSASGIYPFIISPVSSSGSGNVPQGTGYGFMDVQPSGAAAIVGHLGDGTGFSTASTITSGNCLPVYADLYHSAGGVIAGTLVFQDVPNVSDCAGTLYWSRPSIKSSSPYSAGFDTSAQFIADKFDSFISQLNGDDASFVASGADLAADFSTNIKLHFQDAFLPVYAGAAATVQLSLGSIGDGFFGSFKDPVTNKVDSFSGVLLPKSRTGSGLFFSNGQSGSVNVQY